MLIRISQVYHFNPSFRTTLLSIMFMLVYDYPHPRRPKPPRQVDNALGIILTRQHHTYGDPVRGFVHLQNVRRIFLKSIELKFSGENGTNIRYPKKRTMYT